jgi:hypothetical protein
MAQYLAETMLTVTCRLFHHTRHNHPDVEVELVAGKSSVTFWAHSTVLRRYSACFRSLLQGIAKVREITTHFAGNAHGSS